MKPQKTKWDRVIPWIACGLGVLLFIIAIYMLITRINGYSKSEELYDDTKEKYVLSISEDEIVVTEKTDWDDWAAVDIYKLREINEDIAGWIFFENEDISYPVLYSGDNSKYLRMTYTGEHLTSGSIFIEEKNSNDFSDAHTIIYGHNMNDSTMFSKLEYYVTKEGYISDHEYFQIITDKKKYRYKVISYKIVEDDSEIYTVYRKGSSDFVNFVKEDVLNGSLLESDYRVSSDDYLITLSTCFNNKRLVVTAVRCEDCEYAR